MGKRKTHEEYLKQLKDKNISIIPLENYVDAKTKILHRCMVCNYEWTVTPSNIISSYGCPSCNGGHCVEGISDMWTTNPEIAELLKYKEYGHMYSVNSNLPQTFLCPDCENEIEMRPADVNKRGLKCRLCGDGISIPNKFMEQILIFCGLDYYTEYNFDWAKEKRYDFYVPSLNTIIEVNGMQHYNYTGFKSRTIEQEKENDKQKELLAIENGILNYINLDFRYSTLPYMKNSFINSKLYKILNCNFNENEFNDIYLNCMKSKMIKAIELWNSGLNVFDIKDNLKISVPTITTYLHKGNDVNLCKYYGTKNLEKKVYCLTTNKKFNSMKSACEYYNISPSGISQCCKKKSKYCGKLNDGQKLIWIYYEEFIKNNTICN